MKINNERYYISYDIELENKTVLHVGKEEDELLLTDEGKSLIPATSLVGAFRGFLEKSSDFKKEDIYSLFGSTEKESNIVFDDCYSRKPVVLVNRPNLRIDGKTGTGEQRRKFEKQYVSMGNEFSLKISFLSDEETESIKKEIVETCLLALNMEQIRIGAFKTSGAGIFKVKTVKKIVRDLRNKDDLQKYILKENKDFVDVTEEVLNSKLISLFSTFILDCKLETPLLIKGNDIAFSSDLPDGCQIKNSKGEYIIPGTSIKGFLRGRAEKIAKYKNKKYLIEEFFGSSPASGDKNEDMIMGRVFVADAIMNKVKDKGVYNRIKLDKFTQGVITGALMNEKPVLGEFQMRVQIKNGEDKKKNDAVVGLLLLVFRDFAVGNINIGSGYSIGRGRCSCSRMSLVHDKKAIEITLDDITKKTNEENMKSASKLVESFIDYGGAGNEH